MPTGLFIDNEFSAATDNKTIDVENPANGHLLTTIAAAQVADVDRAVLSAEAAFKHAWRFVAPETCRALLNKLADPVQRDAEDLASLQAMNAGVL